MKYKVKLRITDLAGENRKLAFNLEEGLEFLLGKKAVSLRADVCILSVKSGRLEARLPKGVKTPLMLNNQSLKEVFVKPGDILQSNGYAVEFIECPHVTAAETQFVDVSSLRMEATRVGALTDAEKPADASEPETESKSKSEPEDQHAARTRIATFKEPVKEKAVDTADDAVDEPVETSYRTRVAMGKEEDVSLDLESSGEVEPEAEVSRETYARKAKTRTIETSRDEAPSLPSDEDLDAAREREIELERKRAREEEKERSKKLIAREREEREAAERARALARKHEEASSQTRFTRYFRRDDLIDQGGDEVTRFAKLSQDRTEIAVSVGMVFFFSGLAAVAGRFAGFFPGALLGAGIAVALAYGIQAGNKFFRLRHTLQDYLNILAYVSLGAPAAAWAHTRDPMLGAWAFGLLFAGGFGAIFHKFRPEPKRFIPVGVSVSAAVIAGLLSIPHPVEIDVASAPVAQSPADRQPAEAWEPPKVPAPAQGQAQPADNGPSAQVALEPKDMKPVHPAWTKPILEDRVSVPDPLANEQYFTAIREGNLEVVKDLVSRKAVDPSFTLEKGNTGLMIAAAAGKMNIVKYLAQQRVSLNAQDPNGTTALMWAVYRGHKDIAEYLIGRGVNLELRRDDGDRAEDLARRWNRTDIVRIFERHRAEVATREAERRAKEAKLAKAKKGKRAPANKSGTSNLGKIRSLR